MSPSLWKRILLNRLQRDGICQWAGVRYEHMFDSPGIPKGLAEIPPGPKLAGILASIDRDSLSGHHRVAVLKARSRQVAHDEAELMADMAGIVDATALECPVDDPGDTMELAASEVRAALTMTRRAADATLELALQLVDDYPEVWAALREGRISLAKARIICDQTMNLDSETRGQVAALVLETAPGLTTGQLRARLARLVITVDPDGAADRYRTGLEERRITTEPNIDGTANLHGWRLPVTRSQAVMKRINRLARSLKRAGDERTIDQLRADILLDLLDGNAASDTGMSTVDIRVELTTLELADEPGEIPGWGPVIADVARQVVEDQSSSKFNITVTDDGHPVWTGTTRRRPTTHQARQVQTENPTCVFPGCRMPAPDCDIDHTRAWVEGGPTVTDNLSPLCRHDHRLKHAGWKLKRIRPGIYEWTSPLGHSYTTGPDAP